MKPVRKEPFGNFDDHFSFGLTPVHRFEDQEEDDEDLWEEAEDEAQTEGTAGRHAYYTIGEPDVRNGFESEANSLMGPSDPKPAKSKKSKKPNR